MGVVVGEDTDVGTVVGEGMVSGVEDGTGVGEGVGEGVELNCGISTSFVCVVKASFVKTAV